MNAKDPSLRAALVAVHVVFAVAGLTFSSWLSRLPDVRDAMDFTPGEVGLTLFAASLGAVIGLPTAGALSGRFGAPRVVLVSCVVTETALAVAALLGGGLLGAGNGAWLLLAVALFFLGLTTGTWDVAMNLEGAEVERHLGRAVMPHFHASFSAGTVAGAGLGVLAIRAGVPVAVHLAVVAAAAVAAVSASVRRFLAGHVEPGEKGHPLSAWTEPRTLLVGVVVLAAAFTEGAANDWLALGIVDGHGAPKWVGVLGFATFVTSMTLSRLAGTRVIDRFGRVRVLIGCFLLALLGSLLVIFGPGLWAVFTGAALWGAGAALGFPVGMSAAADDPTQAAARVSVAATIGYVAFLVGPPVLGFLGDHFGVLNSLLVVTAVTVLATVVVPATRPLPGSATGGSVPT